MTPRNFVLPLAVLAGMWAFALGITHMRDVGRAEAHDAAAAHDLLGSGSGSYAPQHAETVPPAPDIDMLTKLWRDGAIVDVTILGTFIILGFAKKLDKKHAFYIAVGLAFVSELVPLAETGSTPKLSAIVGAATVAYAIWIRGPNAQPQQTAS